QFGDVKVKHVVVHAVRVGQAAAAESALAEVFQAGGSAKNVVPAGKQRAEPVAEVGHERTVAVRRLVLLEQIVVNVGGHQGNLMDKSNELRIVQPFRGHSQRLLQDVVAHAVGDDGYLGATGRGLTFAGGDTLHLRQMLVKVHEHVGKVRSAGACIFAVWQVAEGAAVGRPGKEDHLAQPGGVSVEVLL